MSLHRFLWRPGILLLALLLSGWLTSSLDRTARSAEASTDPFGRLRQRLVDDGFGADRIQRLFHRPEVRFEARTVGLFFVHSEARLNYDQFTTTAAVARARDYARAHRVALAAAETTYGVEPEVITAILLVETRLGTYLGARRVVNVLSTMAALEDETLKERLWDSLPVDRRLSRERFERKAAERCAWAYEELKAYLRYSARESLDPLQAVGSYAGAVGIAQFLPRNILRLARDGDGDGRVDMFSHADAIASVANYLRHHGWRPGMSDAAARKSVYAYNHSRYYVDTVMTIAARLKEAP